MNIGKLKFRFFKAVGGEYLITMVNDFKKPLYCILIEDDSDMACVLAELLSGFDPIKDEWDCDDLDNYNRFLYLLDHYDAYELTMYDVATLLADRVMGRV